MASSLSKLSTHETQITKQEMKPVKDNKPSFLKRKATLKKKARELATLCGITVCMVCFGPDGEVVTWSENKSEVRDIIIKYRRDYSKKHKSDPSNFLEAKGEKHIEPRDKFERVKLNELSENSMMQLWDFCESNLKAVNERLELQKEKCKSRDTSCKDSRDDNMQNTQSPPSFCGPYGTTGNNLGVCLAVSPWGYYTDMVSGFPLMGSDQNHGNVAGNRSFPNGPFAGNNVSSGSGSGSGDMRLTSRCCESSIGSSSTIGVSVCLANSNGRGSMSG